jgi:predicted molibdopterin-dependent oxidoreductase YjgC
VNFLANSINSKYNKGGMMDMKELSLTIDGMPVRVPEGTTVLAAAKKVGIHIPTLCYHPDLSIDGNCRVCVVEVEGARGLVAACAYPATEGMVVRTNTQVVRKARKMVVELILANHPWECLTCQRNLNCELQKLALDLGIRENILQWGDRRHYPIDTSNPFIIRDNNKCILCGRCVRACHELQCCNVLDFQHRGFETKVAPAFDTPTVESECVFCGACVAVCPVGALTERPMYEEGLPDYKVKTTCPFCGVGCNFDLNVRDGRVIGVTPNPTSVVNGSLTCVKGRFGTDYIHSPERLTTPLIKKDGEFVEATWDEALDLVARKFSEIKNQYGGDAVAALSSARCVNEENYLMQKFMRAVIGTNNVDHCART